MRKTEILIKADPRRNWPKLLMISFVTLLIIVLAAVFAIRRTYLANLQPLNSDQTAQLVTVAPGSSVTEIATLLKERNLIRSDWAFEWHVRSREARGLIQAGTYRLSPSLGVTSIVDLLINGKIDTTTVTIIPGARIDQVEEAFIKVGFVPAEVKQALIAAQYQKHPALADKPPEASLEGYLYPETFHKSTSTKPADIIRLSLDEMSKRLTPELKQAFVLRGLTTHRAVILASIVEQEVGHKDATRDLEDKKKVAQVFLRRLNENIALESDATADYGAILAGVQPRSGYSSAYNTYQNRGLTPGPISNVSQNSLTAVAQPAATGFLYFVSGDPDANGNSITHFSNTLEEHQRLTRQYCKKCS